MERRMDTWSAKILFKETCFSWMLINVSEREWGMLLRDVLDVWKLAAEWS